MTTTPVPLGKRERNKQDKLERIVTAAGQLFDEHGVDAVTTHQIADRAGIGSGTLFLYAKNKGELLLLVQNVHYAAAVAEGRAAAAAEEDLLAAVAALIHEIVRFNRFCVDTGRRYLRELLFGEPDQPHRVRALEIVAEADLALAEVLARGGRLPPSEARERAQIISQVMYMTMALSENVALDEAEVLAAILRKSAVLVDARGA